MTFVEICTELEIPFISEGHEHCREGWIQIDCPFCTPGAQHWRMGYSLRGGYVNCWACGPHALAEVLEEASGSKCRRLLATLELPAYKRKERLKGKLVLPKSLGPLRKAHRTYLQHRGFNSEEVEKLWRIQGIGIATRLAWRIFIPVIYRGDTVSWTTRSISDEHSGRYLSASPKEELLYHKDLLYGEDYVRHAIIVVEGPLDVWTIGPGAVGVLGTGYTQAQIRRISKYAIRVICFDSDDAAQKRASKLCDQLQCFPGETYNVVFETGKDASRSTKREVAQLRRHFLE